MLEFFDWAAVMPDLRSISHCACLASHLALRKPLSLQCIDQAEKSTTMQPQAPLDWIGNNTCKCCGKDQGSRQADQGPPSSTGDR
jgi:hypothetical protein